MRDPHEIPIAKFAQTIAHVRARHAKRFRDILRRERPPEHEEQRVDLRHGAVDAPARAHFSPVEHEAFGDGSECHDRFEKVVVD